MIPLLLFLMADLGWNLTDATRPSEEESCPLATVLVDGPGQPSVTKNGSECEAGVFDLDPQCGDVCDPIPGWDDYDDAWDPESDEHALALMNDALLWQDRLHRFATTKLPDGKLHQHYVHLHSSALIEIATKLLDRWESLTRRKHGPSKKSVRAMKKAWKDALAFAVELRDESEGH